LSNFEGGKMRDGIHGPKGLKKKKPKKSKTKGPSKGKTKKKKRGGLLKTRPYGPGLGSE